MELKVNGQVHSVDADPDTPLLYILRGHLELNAAKYGCGLTQCGACTVMIDGEAVFSCVMPVGVLAGKEITTLEGLGSLEHPGAIQRAFMDEQAAQCGYCIAGMMMRAQALLQKNPNPSEAQVRQQLEPHLCRCGTHMRVLRAVQRAARFMSAGDRPATAKQRS